MATHIRLELEKNKLRLEFFKVRTEQQPNAINKKWVEIYADRVKKLERQLTRAQNRAQAAH
ncbi:MAG: hypothetical protein HY074_04665 [Deltaproteobacteria bacterium]|nr:hypothetical protein [Deltaproteobacteria bacterium]